MSGKSRLSETRPRGRTEYQALPADASGADGITRTLEIR
jgi:hypothetical protein